MRSEFDWTKWLNCQRTLSKCDFYHNVHIMVKTLWNFNHSECIIWKFWHLGDGALPIIPDRTLVLVLRFCNRREIF